MKPLSHVIIGNGSLLVQCSEILLERGHSIAAIVSENQDITQWAVGKNLPVHKPGVDLDARLGHLKFDWLLSIANLEMIEQNVLDLAQKGAVNFHDGPLPRYAGLNAPVWALLNGEKRHGITWHLIENGVDEGDILEQTTFDLADGETALTLNTRCFEAAIDSFPTLLENLENGAAAAKKQDLSQRSYCARDDQPKAAGLLDCSRDAAHIVDLVRALDHGDYWNPLSSAKIAFGDQIIVVGSAVIAGAANDAEPGTVLEVNNADIVVATGSVPVRFAGLRDQNGRSLAMDEIISAGQVANYPDDAGCAALNLTLGLLAKHENHWRNRLSTYHPAQCNLAEKPLETAIYAERKVNFPDAFPVDQTPALIGVWVARMGGDARFDLAYRGHNMPESDQQTLFADWVPVRFGPVEAGANVSDAMATFRAELEKADRAASYALDLIARDQKITPPKLPDFGIVQGADAAPIIGTCLTVEIQSDQICLHYDTTRLSGAAIDLLTARLDFLLHELFRGKAGDHVFADLSVLPKAERQALIVAHNQTAQDYDASLCVHQHFEAQVLRNPDAIAAVFEDQNLSYQDLNSHANQAAHVLIGMGVKPGAIVGLSTHRSLDLLVGALAILKAGAAYVPLDPTYPRNRLDHTIKDSALSVIVSTSDLAGDLPENSAQILQIDTDPRLDTAAKDNPDSGVTADDLAYLIYTSGSTGKPKGVMVEHHNVTNFFTGMDERVRPSDDPVWLAVTSLSFDISVLELFYTLARGHKLVIAGDENRAAMSSGELVVSDTPMDFSLYFWGNDDGVGRDKYKLLLEGSKFADKNGFTAVWTPERHFHAFGGPYPNPSVTGAAVAAVTQNLSVRSGSCVAPLHHTARIAEEWAVIDNLTNGRAGLGIASGWQPDDFVLCPENTPPENKPAMFQAIKDLRALWRGETVDFPKQNGESFAVLTQPRPVSKELPIWVTIAGNPDTWREAGEIGAHVLTHLLGQTADEVADRIALYHDALRGAGHDPADFKVTLMLHSFVGVDRQIVRETARGPMKAYMGAAAGLIRQCAWDFPAFKRPKGVKKPFEIDLAILSADEVDAILEFAFERYFEDAGLFGTVNDCLKRVEQLKAIGVNEIACLIDYGIPVSQVLESLVPLADVLRRANLPSEPASDDYSIAAQIQRHRVTHLQCTPSMARMFTMNDGAKTALAGMQQLLIGGEALPGSLVAELAKITDAPIENMYGPTETTIWSSSETARPVDGPVNIGTPIANTQLYVLDAAHNPVPFGAQGELYIAGSGVTRGYWQRDELTTERFLPDPFSDGKGRMYRTGDLVSRRPDGKIDFLGRVDHQVKLRGYRIEPGEVEAALETLPEVLQAVAMMREDVPGDTRLVAYIRANPPISGKQMRQHLRLSLPEFMIPSHFVPLAEFPLTPNKKIDRNALPALAANKVAPAVTQNTLPSDDIEAKIATIWASVLGLDKVGSQDSFFDLGGHSLLAVQAHREIREAFEVAELAITDIFRFPVLKSLADHIKAMRSGDKPDAAPDPVMAKERARDRSDAMAKRRAMRARRLPG